VSGCLELNQVLVIGIGSDSVLVEIDPLMVDQPRGFFIDVSTNCLLEGATRPPVELAPALLRKPDRTYH
jgi:hypothetical protein